MERRLFRLLPFIVAIGSISCAASHAEVADDEPSSTSDDALGAKLPAPAVAGQRLYFPNVSKPLPYNGGSMAWPYPAAGAHVVTSAWTFGAKGGSSFSLSVSAFTDGEPLSAAPVSLTTYYLSRGKWRRAGSASGTGAASVALSPSYDHQWLVVASGDVVNDGNNLEIALGCASPATVTGHSACAIANEPGDGCSVKHSCDTGLSCACGACATSAAIASCAPPPACAFSGVPADGATLEAKTWQSADRVFTYTFAADGTFAVTFDRCASSTCKIATLHKTGHFSSKGQNVSLSYDDGASANLVYQRSCKGELRLDGTDFMQQVDAAPLP